MGLMALIHRVLLKKGKLDSLLPDQDDFDDREERDTAKAEIEARTADDEKMRREVRVAVRRLEELNSKNHYGESLRRAFGGR